LSGIGIRGKTVANVIVAVGFIESLEKEVADLINVELDQVPSATCKAGEPIEVSRS